MCNRAAERRRTKKKNDDYGEHGIITCVRMIAVSKQKLPCCYRHNSNEKLTRRLHRGIGFYDERNSWATAIASNSSFSSPFIRSKVDLEYS